MAQTDDKNRKPTMNDKQRRFVDEYLIDSNGTRAAIAAGYGEKNARSTASKLLRVPEIAAEIKRRRMDLCERAGLTAAYVREHWKDVIDTCSQRVMAVSMNGDPVLKPDGTQAERLLDAGNARMTLKDVAAHLQMFEKPEEPPKEDGNTGVLMSPGVASREDWDNG